MLRIYDSIKFSQHFRPKLRLNTWQMLRARCEMLAYWMRRLPKMLVWCRQTEQRLTLLSLVLFTVRRYNVKMSIYIEDHTPLGYPLDTIWYDSDPFLINQETRRHTVVLGNRTFSLAFILNHQAPSQLEFTASENPMTIPTHRDQCMALMVPTNDCGHEYILYNLHIYIHISRMIVITITNMYIYIHTLIHT